MVIFAKGDCRRAQPNTLYVIGRMESSTGAPGSTDVPQQQDVSHLLSADGTLTIPPGTDRTSPYQFAGCAAKAISFPPTLKYIAPFTFADCDQLLSLTLPPGLLFVGEGAFDGCSRLLSVTIPGTVEYLGAGCFIDCEALRTVQLQPGALAGLEYNTFCGCRALKQVALPRNVVAIGESAFHGCTNLSNIRMPCVETIGCYSFWACRNLVSVDRD